MHWAWDLAFSLLLCSQKAIKCEEYCHPAVACSKLRYNNAMAWLRCPNINVSTLGIYYIDGQPYSPLPPLSHFVAELHPVSLAFIQAEVLFELCHCLITSFCNAVQNLGYFCSFRCGDTLMSSWCEGQLMKGKAWTGVDAGGWWEGRQGCPMRWMWPGGLVLHCFDADYGMLNFNYMSQWPYLPTHPPPFFLKKKKCCMYYWEADVEYKPFKSNL